MGSAYRAKYAMYSANEQISNTDEQAKNRDESLSYYDFVVRYLPNHLERICEPSKDSDEIYTPMLDRYRQMANILQSSK